MFKQTEKRKREPYFKFINFLRENNIPQAEVAELLNKGVSAFNQNLSGLGGDLTVSEVKKICEKYNVSADIFL